MNHPERLGSGAIANDVATTILDTLPDGVFTLDTAWRFTYINAQAARYFGASAPSLLGRTLWEVVPSSVGSKVDTEYHRAVQDNTTVQFTTQAFLDPTQLLEMRAHPTTEGLALHLLKSTERSAELPEIAHEITAQRKVAEELRRALEELQQTTAAAPVALFISRDPRCEVITGNPVALRLFGVEESDANISKGLTTDTSLTPTEQPATHRRFFCPTTGRELSAADLPMQQAILQNREVRDQLLYIENPTGGRIYITGVAVPLRDDTGGVRGAIGAFMDITARVNAENALRESEERLRLAGKAAGIGYWSWDLKSGRWELDKSCADMFGVTQECHLNEILGVIAADDIERVREDFQHSIVGYRAYRTEFRVRNSGSSPRWLLGLGDVTRDPSGLAVRMSGVTIDISLRKEGEAERQRLVSLVENSSEFMSISDLSGGTVFINYEALKLTGLNSFEIAKRTPVRDLFFPDDQDFIVNTFFPQVLQDGHGEVEIRFRHFRTGAPIWVIYSASVVRDVDGRIAGMAAVARDITERKQTERWLKESAKRKDEFLAVLAHELRNPLAPISNALQVWHRIENNPEQSARLRGMMERQVAQLKHLIDDLLDISRISRGKIEIRRERFNIATAIEEAIESVSAAIESNKQSLSLDLPAEAIVIEGDSRRLTQVVGNLLSNATKYTQHNGHIRVSAKIDGSNAVISVGDDGLGIPGDMLQNIFEPFVQVHNGLDRAQGGLGIGLTLVKTLVELHGGTVEAISAGPGQGTEFIVRLPAVQTSGEAALPPASETATKKAQPNPIPSRKILVIDDVKPSADTLAMMLEDLGQEAQVAYDGPSGLKAIEEFHPDVVFSDIAMPGMDGYHVAETIHHTTSTPPFLIAITGYGQEHDRKRALAAGFNYHLVKPTTLEALQALLTQIVVPKSSTAHQGPA